MIQRTTIYPGVYLTCIQDRRFKQNCVSIQYLREMRRGESGKNALIPSVLLRGCKSAPDLRQITLRLDDLYGASVSPISRRAGDYQASGFYVSLMDDRFALDGESVLEKTLDFVTELLFDYPTEDGGFLKDFVEGEKINQIAAIESELNDKRVYAAQKLLETLCGQDPYGVPKMGTRQEVEAITPQELLRHYEALRRESPVEVYYVGSADPGRVADLVRKMFAREVRQPRKMPGQTDLTPGVRQDRREAMEVAQGKLCMGFLTPITNRDHRFAAMQVTNGILGGDVTSKLFQNVREKQSLCYSIGSGYYAAKGIVLVSAGIDFDKEDHVRREVLSQLEGCQLGQITDEELAASKQSLLTALRSVQDSPSAMENYYSAITMAQTGRSWETHMDLLAKVTKEDVVACAKTLELHSTYFLEGGDFCAAL